MNGIEKITNKIVEDAQASADKLIADANARAADILGEAARKKQTISDDMFNSAMAEGENIINSARSTLERNSKAIISNMKNAMVNEAFEGAKNEIASLETEKYTNLMTKLLCRVLSSRIDEEKRSMRLFSEDISPDRYEVIMNKRDRDTCGVYIVAGVRRATVGKITGDVLDKVTLSQEVADISGGFILRMGRVEINASIEAILGEIREQTEPDIMDMLFPSDVSESEE